MSAVGMNPTFGNLTTSYARGPQATKAFQNAEFNFISSTNNTQNSGSTKLNADVAADYKGIMQMQGQKENVSFMKNPIKYISNMVLANKLDKA